MKLFRIFLVLIVLAMGNVGFSQNANVIWWLVGSTTKIQPILVAPNSLDTPLELHVATQEYAPFQIVFGSSSSTSINLSLDYPGEYFEVALYDEFFLPLTAESDPLIFTSHRLQAQAIPDGLRPLEGALEISPELPAVVWVDVFVKPETPAGDYTITINTEGAGSRQATVHVYPVQLPIANAIEVIIPIGVEWTIPFFGGDDPAGFHAQVNQLLIDHYIVPGNWVSEPVLTETGWDFSGVVQEIQQLPLGTTFLTPIPYNTATEEYRVVDSSGQPFAETDFSNPEFVAAISQFFTDLAKALSDAGRLQEALVYPNDEIGWVADEPIHNGPEGFAHLGEWTKVIREAGLRVIGSWVTPSPIGDPAFGWLPGTDVVDNFHVHQDFFEGAPEHFQEFIPQGYETSVYLNNYGDMLDIPSDMHRAMLWRAYANDVSQIMGYADMEWVDEIYNPVDPWEFPEKVYPQFGYGGGALVWPGPLPSLRMKVLREGIEDVRLLDVYGQTFGIEAAKSFATCLTPGALADQNPPDDLWDEAHESLLIALTDNQPIPEGTLCQPEPTYETREVLLDMDNIGATLQEWEAENVDMEFVPSSNGNGVQITYIGDGSTVSYPLDFVDWTGWTAMLVTVHNPMPYFASLDIGLTDGNWNYGLLRSGAISIGPNTTKTLILPLKLEAYYFPDFDWTSIQYLTLEVATETTWTNKAGETNTFQLGTQTLIFDDFVLVR